MKTQTEQDTESAAGVDLAGDANGDPATMTLVTTPQRPRILRDPLIFVAMVLAIAAAVCAVVFGVRWITAANGGTYTYSLARDKALQAGEQAIKNLNTIDYHNVQGSLNLWVDSTTGDLRTQMVGYTKDNNIVSTIQKAKTVTTAKILQGALTAFNDHDGTATIIAAVDVTVTPDGQKATDKRTRIQGNLTRSSNGDWLLNQVGPVAVQSAGQSGQ